MAIDLNLNYADLMRPLVKIASRNGSVICLVGRHGTGKSWMAKEIAAELGLYFHKSSAPALDRYDMKGVQCRETPESRKAFFTRPGEFPPEGEERVLWLFEEVTDSDLQDVLKDLITSRQINGWKLPKFCVFMLVGNLPENGGTSREMIEPLIDRGGIFTINPEYSQWERDFIMNYRSEEGTTFHQLCWGFLEKNKKKGYLCMDKLPGELTSASPRSWTTLGTIMEDIIDEPSHVFIPMVAGYIGTKMAQELATFKALRGYVVPISKILSNPKTTPLPTSGGDFSDYDLKFFQTFACGDCATNANAEDLLAYVTRMGPEFVKIFGQRLEVRGMTKNAAYISINATPAKEA